MNLAEKIEAAEAALREARRGLSQEKIRRAKLRLYRLYVEAGYPAGRRRYLPT